MDKNSRVLISVATHGDEGFAIPVVKGLKRKYSFAIRVNNPRALRKRVRYLDADMNRCAPGKSSSVLYEERRARQNLKFATNFDQVIDIHGSVSECGVFLILSDASWQNIELAKKFDVQNVVLWPSLSPRGPLTQFIPNSLEIECGPMSALKTQDELQRVLERFLRKETRRTAQQIYIVTGVLQGNIQVPMQDFIETTYNGRTFTPLLVDQYTGIKCYMLAKLNDTLLDSE